MARKPSAAALALEMAQAENESLRQHAAELAKMLGEERAKVTVLTAQSLRLDENRSRWEDLRSAVMSARHVLRDTSARLGAAADNLHRDIGTYGGE